MRIASHCKPGGHREGYVPKQSWPKGDNGWMQWGDCGLVLGKGSIEETLESKNPIEKPVEDTSYMTAFFEVFPENPSTFIRGKGKNLESAEKEAYEKFVKNRSCQKHEFEMGKAYTTAKKEK